MAAPVPVVEITDDAHAFRIGSPHGEQDSRHLIHFMDMGPQELMGMPVFALPEQVEVERTELRGIRVGIQGDMLAVLQVPAQNPIVAGKAGAIAPPLEEIALFDADELEVPFEDEGLEGVGKVGPNHGLLAEFVAAKDGEGIVVTGIEQAVVVLLQGEGAGHHRNAPGNFP
jgi:hypothetical protein